MKLSIILIGCFAVLIFAWIIFYNYSLASKLFVIELPPQIVKQKCINPDIKFTVFGCSNCHHMVWN